MTFQIQAIYLYRKSGEVRELRFRPGRLNIVTGASKTGKSSILSIIDYCLGSKDCPIAAGVIRDEVAYFALRLNDPRGDMIIGRPAPAPGAAATTKMHVSVTAAGDDPPILASLTTNSDARSAAAFLSEFAGIGEARPLRSFVAGENVRATIRHTLFFCLQHQDEIASRSGLFHSQGEEWRFQAIRDVLPYFLGASVDEEIALTARLREARRELRELERELAEQRGMTQATGIARKLLRQAFDAGLLEGELSTDLTEVEALERLAVAAGVHPVLVAAGEGLEVDRYSELLVERQRLRSEVSLVKTELQNLDLLTREVSDFSQEAQIQVGRLQSLNLLSSTEEPSSDLTVCPVCASNLESPSLTVRQLRDSLSNLQAQVGAISRDSPRTAEIRAEHYRRLDSALKRLRENQEELQAARSAMDDSRDLETAALIQAATKGRISLYLDSHRAVSGSQYVESRIRDLKVVVQEITDLLSSRLDDGFLDSALSRVSRRISSFAEHLGLEHSSSPVRLDLKNLTVVADTSSGPVPLKEMGSGENWVGYHVATFLALHEFFVENNRPVPRFLIIDQPSQVFFPADVAEDSRQEPTDEDRAALVRLLQTIRSLVESIAPNLQVILTEHADIDESWFQDAVIERWRDGTALVPNSWITDHTI